MLTAMLDAGDAGRRVGYSSAAQFSREYGRFFGSAPTQDINRLREEGLDVQDLNVVLFRRQSGVARLENCPCLPATAPRSILVY
jgi:AraC-like DNA-binding protein